MVARVQLTDGARPLPTSRTAPLAPPPDLLERARGGPASPLLFPDGHEGWLITGYDLAREVLSHPAISSDSARLRVPVRRDGAAVFLGQTARPGWFVDMDPPDHSRYRRQLGRFFAPARARAYGAVVERSVTEALARLRDLAVPFDLVQHFANPVPAEVIRDLLGVPRELQADFEAASSTLFSLAASADDGAAALTTLTEIFEALARHCRKVLGDDLFSALVVGTDLDDTELAGVGVLICTAALDSVAGMIGLGAYALLQQPRQRALLLGEEEGGTAAVDELLRYLTVFHLGLPRVATSPVVFGDVEVAAGQCVLVSLGAGNWEEQQFTEPAELRLDREPVRHLALGHGIHQCLGQHLARIEIGTALRGLLSTFPDLRLDRDPGAVEFADDSGRYGMRRMLVRI